MARLKLRADQLFRCANIEIIRLARVEMVAFAQKTNDLPGSLGHGFARCSGAKDIIEPKRPSDSFLHGGVGEHDEIVLVLAAGRHSLGSEDSNHPARQVL